MSGRLKGNGQDQHCPGGPGGESGSDMDKEVPRMMLEPAMEKRIWRWLSESCVSKAGTTGCVAGILGEEKREGGSTAGVRKMGGIWRMMEGGP